MCKLEQENSVVCTDSEFERAQKMVLCVFFLGAELVQLTLSDFYFLSYMSAQLNGSENDHWKN